MIKIFAVENLSPALFIFGILPTKIPKVSEILISAVFQAQALVILFDPAAALEDLIWT